MYERHDFEQYFFDTPTLAHLTRFVAGWERPCCVCAPLLGRHLAQAGVDVTMLDVDERFQDVPGFQRYDIYRPTWLGTEFGLIICDPPFFRVSLSQLFHALRMLSRYDLSQPMLVSYLSRRSSAVTGTFAPFGVKPTGYFPGYQTVEKLERNEIEFFGNLDAHQLERLHEEA